MHFTNELKLAAFHDAGFVHLVVPKLRVMIYCWSWETSRGEEEEEEGGGDISDKTASEANAIDRISVI